MRSAPPLLLVVLIWAAGLGAAAQFGKMSILYQDLGRVYAGHGPAGLGLVVSITGGIGLIFGTTAGMLVGRLGGKRALVAALALGAVASLVQTLLPPYPVMILLRVVEGISHLAIVVVGPSRIAGLASPAWRPMAMTLWASFFGVTYTLLAALAPPLLAWGGMQALFLAHAGWMAALALALGILLPSDRPQEIAPATGLLRRHLEIYASPRLAAPGMGFIFYTFLYVAALTLIPGEAPAGQRILLATGMPLISILVSLTLGVWLLSRISAVRLVQAGFLAALPGFVLLGLGWGAALPMSIAALWLSAALGLVQGASFASIPELNPTASDRAEAAGAIAQLGNVGTTAGTPVLAAALAGFGPWAFVLTGVLCCATGILVHQWQAMRRRAAAQA